MAKSIVVSFVAVILLSIGSAVVAEPTGTTYSAQLSFNVKSPQTNGSTAVGTEVHSGVVTFGPPNPELMTHNTLSSAFFNQPNDLNISETTTTVAGVETIEIRIQPTLTPLGSNETLTANPIRTDIATGANMSVSGITWDQTNIASATISNIRVRVGVDGQCNDVALTSSSISGDGSTLTPLAIFLGIPGSALESGGLRAGELVLLVDVVETFVSEPSMFGLMALGLLGLVLARRRRESTVVGATV